VIRWAASIGNPSSILTRNVKSEVGAIVRWFTWFPGNAGGSIVDHYVYLLSNHRSIVEALAIGMERGDLSKYRNSDCYWGVIVEHVGFTDRQHLIADGAALALVHAPYNFIGVLKQAGDGIASKLLRREVCLFRRMRLPWVVAYYCSEAGARIHAIAGWRFFCRRRAVRKVRRSGHVRIRLTRVLTPLPFYRANPDSLWDDMFEYRPNRYRVVGEINPHLRPADLIEHGLLKIESDLRIAARS
jgi:hypothetical protein